MIARPKPDEYAPLYTNHIKRVPDGADVFQRLRDQPDELRTLLSHISEADAEIHPAPGEWSVKEVVGHTTDTDRIFGYRALRIARGDTTPLVGYNPPAYVESTNFNARSIQDLVDEFDYHRRSTVLFLIPLTAEEIGRSGTIIDHPMTVRALLYAMYGHVAHHIESLKTTYKVGGE